MAADVERVYSNGYRQQYSDLLNMLISIENESDQTFDEQNLCDNLEILSEHIRTSVDENGDLKYSMDAFLGITKLADHIALEIQRDRDYQNLERNVRRAQMQAHVEASKLSEDIKKANRTVKKARREAQNSKVELVAILSIFAALVIAFSGGLTYLGGTISSSANASIGSTVFSVLICGLMLFNIIAFLMVMVIVIVRLHREEDEPILSHGMIASLGLVIAVFNIVLIAAICVILDMGIVTLRVR